MGTNGAGKKLEGTRVGRYTLIQHLASGGMAEIFLARHEGQGGFSKELVLKVLQPRFADNREVLEMFWGEGRLGAMLAHPNIVDVYDVGEADGLPFIAMEHIAGRTLTDLVRRGIEVGRPVSIEHAVHLVMEAAAGLAYMHEGTGADGRPFQIVHRDISPSNLIISAAGELKIIDFGIARQGTAVKEDSGVRPGKASYMAPEQVKGLAVDRRSDIFALGTILYEITLGRRLWRGPRELAMQRIVDERPAPPTYLRRDYPPALELVALRALEKRPEDRYQSASAFFHDLDQFLATCQGRVRSREIAIYLHGLWDAEVTESGARQVKLFDDDADEPLDFDRPAPGAGEALARALRASGPNPVMAAGVEARLPGPEGAGPHGAPAALRRTPAAEPAATSAAAAPSGYASAPSVPLPEVPAPFAPPPPPPFSNVAPSGAAAGRTRRVVLAIALAVVSAAAAGFAAWLITGA